MYLETPLGPRNGRSKVSPNSIVEGERDQGAKDENLKRSRQRFCHSPAIAYTVAEEQILEREVEKISGSRQLRNSLIGVTDCEAVPFPTKI